MAMWLFQLNQRDWPAANFRNDIWENSSLRWPHRKIQGKRIPARGDVVCFFYSEATGKEPGIYGWAIIDWCDEEDIQFTPTTPTNHLKVDPWWDGEGGEVAKLIDEIRTNPPRATMFEITTQSAIKIKVGIKKWLSS